MAVILCHGSMCSGKSDMARSIVKAFSNVGLSSILYQPKENTRDVFRGSPVWFSRSAVGNEYHMLPANWYNSAEDVLKEKNNFDVFGFDEWHMYKPEIYDVIKELHNSGKFVVAAGGDYYFNGEPVEIFEKLRKIKGASLLRGSTALCQDCLDKKINTPAVRTQRMHGFIPDYFDAPKIVVEGGANYQYKPVCFDHWRVDPPRDNALMGEFAKWYTSKRKSH